MLHWLLRDFLQAATFFKQAPTSCKQMCCANAELAAVVAWLHVSSALKPFFLSILPLLAFKHCFLHLLPATIPCNCFLQAGPLQTPRPRPWQSSWTASQCLSTLQQQQQQPPA
jgi:hypothetical protein